MAAVSQQQQARNNELVTAMAATPSPIAPADAAKDPLAAVRALHASRSRQSSPAEDGDWGVTELFRAVAEDEELAKTVPTLTRSNVDSIPQHALVRYRGMVQDTLDPEYYLGAYLQGGAGSDEWATTKFADAVPPAAAAAAAAAAEEAAGGGGKAPCCAHAAAALASARPPPASAVWERRPLYCVSVPGEKGEEEEKAATAAVAPAAPSASAKRGREGNGNDEEMEEPAAPAPEAGEKKKREGERKNEDKKAEADDGKPPPPSPLPPRAGDAMVFFYPSSGPSELSPKLNDVVEVWGVLSRVPELAAAHLDGGEPSRRSWAEAQELAARPPTSEVPRVHALFVRKCEAHPRLSAVAREHGFGVGETTAVASQARAAALAALRRCLRGDSLAAEYVLLQLVSRVHLRTAGLALGTLALDVTGCPPGTEGGEGKALSEFGASVAETLSRLAPRVVPLPLSLPALNGARLRPGRCPLSGRLAQAPLQVAPGTQVLLDETSLRPGALGALGRDSVDALRGLVADKSVEYDFGYCRGAMPCDAPVTILSSGKGGSVLRGHVDVTVPLQPEEILDEETGDGREKLVDAAAALFDSMRTAEFSFGEGDGEPMESDDAGKKGGGAPRWLEEKLLDARRRGATSGDASTAAPSSSEADLHLALTLARLYALSHGETTLRPEHWEGARRMEGERRARLAVGGVRAAYTG